MTRHHQQALAMQRAVVKGDLAGFARAATFVAENDLEPGAPASWKPHAEALRQSAERARGAASLEEAAAGVGALGQSCAGCHRALGGPVFTLGQAPPESASVEGHMARHQWAADRLWEGLIAPSTESWVGGAEAMAVARLTAERMAPATPEVDALARRVHFQANAARLLAPEDRGRAYGEFLATCSTCHHKVGVR